MAKKQGNRSKAKRWQDEELRLLYSQYHKSGFDGRQLAAALPGRSPEECEALCQQYQTVLEQPHDPSHEAEFVAVVKGIHKMTGDIDADTSGVEAAAQAPPAAANGNNVDSADADGQHEQDEADDDDAHQDEQQQFDEHQYHHLQQHGIKEGSLAHRLAIELNGLSQGYSQGMGSQGGSQGGAVAGMYDTGDEGEQGGGGASSQGARPQRVRKPKQYLGEPVTTPRAGQRGSLPNTPSSSTRRKLARGAAAAAGRRRAAGCGVAAFYGSPVAIPSSNTYLDSGSAKKRRSRRLFEGGQLHELPEHAEHPNLHGFGGYYDSQHDSQWEHDDEAYPEHVSDDVEEGVDALLSLASMAHASSSCQTGSQGLGQHDDDGDYYQQQQAGYGSYAAAGRSGRSRSHKQQQLGRSSGMCSVDDGADGDEEAEPQHDQHDGYAAHEVDPAEAAATPTAADSDAEDAAGGLAAMKADGSQGWGTPKRPTASDFIYRTGTPGGVARGDFVLASPGLSDKHGGPGIPLPSPSGRGRGARGTSLFAGAAAVPKSPGGRGRGGRRGRRGRGRGRGSSRAAAAARESGYSAQRAGSAGALEGGLSGSLDGGAMGVSDGEGGAATDEEPELMDAAELAGAGLSSPHLRTNSANEPPRSRVLLGKRGERDAGEEDTPASHRSVRQRVDGETASTPFNLPLPLFAAGGSGAAAAADLPSLGGDLLNAAVPVPVDGSAAAAAAADAAQLQQQAAPKAEEEAIEGRGTRGRSKRKQLLPAPVKNRRKPLRSGFNREGGLRGLLGSRAHARADHGLPELPLPRSEAALRHMTNSRLRRWVMYEWHYSAIDRPYFMRNEMQELLDASGLGHVTHLTRPEWSVLRGAFGRPRRLSLAFLKQERLKLELYRERVRGTYEALGPGADVPADMPRQLKVAQPVVARHPQTRSLHDGIILTLKPNKYRVQFNRTDLLSEVVRDTDVMPLDPSEALPIALVHAHMQPLLNGRPTSAAGAQALTSAAGALAARRRQQQLLMAAAQQQQMRAAGLSEQEARVDQQLLAELSGVLDRKEGLLSKLRTMNTQASTGGHIDQTTGRPAESFQNSYAAVVSSLQAINGELQQLLSRLQGRSHLNMNSLAAAAVAAPAAAMSRSAAVVAAQPDAAAAAAAPVVAPGVGPLQPGVTMLLRRPSGPPEVAAAASPAPSGTAGPAAAAAQPGAASALVQDATAEARSMVQRIRAQQQQAAAEGEAGNGSAAAAAAGSPAPPQEESRVDDIITGCVSMLVTVHKLTSPSLAGQQSAGAAALEAALEAALQQLKPKAAANGAAFVEIMNSVGRLKAQLAKAH